jgi:UDP-N-acetylmuramoyl-tripeptide--D-alanyl-D-alanine ligase
MKVFTVENLAETLNAEVIPQYPASQTQITGVSIDSRTTKAGDCFFAIAGDNFDGADFLPDAFAKGAVCAVVADSKRKKSTGDCILKVHDTIKALGDFALKYRQQMNFKVVAITGSAGKTMTRQITYHTLSQHYHAFQSPKNFNNNIGLPLTLLGAGHEDQIVVVELGSNCPGEIAYLTRIALPDIAVVTNVHQAHLAGFGDIKNITREKLSIAEGLKSDGVLIINADCEPLISTCRANLKPRATGHEPRLITFGKSDLCDIQARNITYNDFASSFTIDGTQILLPLPGPGNVENAVAAFSVCSRFGLTTNDFADAIRTLPAVPMRAELLQIGTLTVLNDCYNANPASMKNALDILANLKSAEKRRRIFICGDMAELGQQSRQLHTELGGPIPLLRV